jgi:hypothetical protein
MLNCIETPYQPVFWFVTAFLAVFCGFPAFCDKCHALLIENVTKKMAVFCGFQPSIYIINLF